MASPAAVKLSSKEQENVAKESVVSERVLGSFSIAAADILTNFESRIGTTGVMHCETQASELLEKYNSEKISANDYTEIIKEVSELYPVPTQESIVVKTLILQKLTSKMLESIKNVDPVPVIIANLDLINEINIVEASAKDNLTGMKPFKNRVVAEYMARAVGSSVKLYHHAFENRNKDEIYLVEKALVQLRSAYPKTDEKVVPFDQDRRGNVEGILSGIRAEAFAWIHLDSFFDSITSIPGLSDATLEQKFPGVSANDLRDMYYYIEETVGFAGKNFNLIVEHAPNDMDAKGQADLCVYAVEPESAEKQILFLVDVKTAPVIEDETPIRYQGVYVVTSADKNRSIPVAVGENIWPPVPFSSVKHARKINVPVLSVRIPNVWTRQSRRSTIAKKELITDIASGDKIQVQDIAATLRAILKTKPEQANEDAVSVITGLLRNRH